MSKGYVLSPQDLDAVRRMANWVKTFGGDGVDNSGGSAAVRPRGGVQQAGPGLPLMITCKITSAVGTRIGWYNAKSARKAVNPNPTGDLVETDITGGWADEEDTLVQYVPELGGARLIADFEDLTKCIVVGLVRGFDLTLKRRVIEVTGGGGSSLLRPCTLAKTSGNDGTASAACSWVYTVTDALTEAEVATGRSPAHRRLYGTTYYATVGLYYLDSEGTCILHWTDEQPKPFGCTTA